MCKTYNVSIVTVRKWMNNTIFEHNYSDHIKPDKDIILLMDTTYFWRKYWYMIFRAWFPEEKKWKNLLRYKIHYETNEKYKEWYRFLKQQWRNIIAIVCDWRQGLLWWFGDIPTQMCLYHMKQIVTRLLTKRPRLPQNKRLKLIVSCIGDYPEEDIQLALDVRAKENKEWLNEKNAKWWYIHERTRKAYRSIRRKLCRCYTFAHYPDLRIPKTNNSLESINSHAKTKIAIHRWLKERNKDTFMNYYLYNS